MIKSQRFIGQKVVATICGVVTITIKMILSLNVTQSPSNLKKQPMNMLTP